MNDDKLIQALEKLVRDTWKNEKEPVLLSALPRILELTLPDFREILNGRSIKKFIVDTGASGNYELVEHPSIRAKISVAPKDSNYQFPDSEKKPAYRKYAASKKTSESQEITLSFLKEVGNLAESEQDKIVIPVSILAKLLK
ncbi:hypothetical protein [Alcaligenes aquatilis]|uniref:hypothetical protein n=1 Tax=Alcaligenes aquatilis TaxID=323284 RepID=UPI003F91238F